MPTAAVSVASVTRAARGAPLPGAAAAFRCLAGA